MYSMGWERKVRAVRTKSTMWYMNSGKRFQSVRGLAVVQVEMLEMRLSGFRWADEGAFLV